jgi:hypothetical protein
MLETREFSTDLAAAYVREAHDKCCSAFQLAKLRSRGLGPRYMKRHGRIVYRQADLDAWATGLPARLAGPFPADEHAAA